MPELLGPVVQRLTDLGATAIHIHTSSAGALLSVKSTGWSFVLGLWPRRRVARFASPTRHHEHIDVPLDLDAIEQQARELAREPFPMTFPATEGDSSCA